MSVFFFSLLILPLIFNQPHPLFFALGLLTYSLLISLSLMSLVNVWLGLSLALIFLGGMMVIILYMSALASEYKFSIYNSESKFLLLFWVLIPVSISVENSAHSTSVIYSLYFSFSSFSMILLLLYLLLTLIIVVLVSEFHQGPVSSWN